MEVMTIRQYAESRHITYEAVRKQVIRYKAELAGHITQNGKSQVLDSVAVSFLDEHRDRPSIVVADEEQIRENAEQAQTIIDLQNQLIALHEQLSQQKDITLGLQQQLLAIEDVKAEARIALEQKDRLQADLEQTRADLQASREENRQTKQDLEQARAEADSYQKSWFGLYRKKQ